MGPDNYQYRDGQRIALTDHTLGAIALAIHAPAPADFRLAIGFGWNAGMDVGLMRGGAEDW